MKRALFLAIVIAGLLNAVVPAQSPPPDAFKFFKNYFGTFRHVLGGVGLKGQGTDGFATGLIQLSGAPESGGHPTVDVMAALLYWQVVTKDSNGPDWGAVGVKFDGMPLSSSDGVSGRVQGTGTPPCWSSGGGTGSGGGAWKTYTYRADVLRYLDIDAETGKYRLNGGYSVTLPDGGDRLALGAGLFVLYRDTSTPFSAYVLYDGGVTINNSNPTWSVNMVGFYQPAPSPNAEVFTLVGSGQANKREDFSFTYPSATIAATYPDPFSASNGPAWDSMSFPVSLGSSPGTVSQVTTTIDTAGLSGSDCLTPAMVGFKTAVLDTDGDGLLDVWESPTPPTDPYGVQLPDLAAMGASPDHKDVFIEVGYMKTDADTTYGSVVKAAHSHLPVPAAFKLAGDAFKNAPVWNPDGTSGIRLHIDAGSSYPSSDADEYMIREPGLARGGEFLDESITTPPCARGPEDPVWKCQFQGYPGTVGWKTGFRYLRDEVLSGPPPPTDPGAEDPCDLPGNTCVRRFDANRMDSFHYAFFAHAVGMPKSLYACLSPGGPDGALLETPDVDGHCPAGSVENPAFFEPRTNSGIGDFPGRDFMLTLGAFSDRSGRPGGTDFMVASTFVHELGHNLELRHGAWQDTTGRIVPGPNCVPTYLSVMNYLYQLRGLLDDEGRPHIDFSGLVGSLPGDRIDERDVNDGPLPFTPNYRLGWYAPLEGSYFDDPGGRPRTTIAGRHCDGSLMFTSDVDMVRVDARTAAGGIDWNADGDLTDGHSWQDVNFNGRTELAGSPELPQAFNDWANIRLNQIGAGRNVGGPFLDDLGRKAFGPLSADLARADWARADWARADWARADWARADWARADWGDLSQGDLGRYALARADWARADWARADWARADWARADWGRGDDGRGDFGGGDLFVGDPNNAGGCLDHETATFLANTAPYEFTCALEGFRVRCEWVATNEGGEIRYALYRVEGTVLAADQEWVPLTTVTATGADSYSVTFDDTLKKGADYLYFATAVYQQEVAGAAGEVESNPSDTAHIVGPNHVPVANAQSVIAFANAPTPITLTGSDPDGDSLVYVVTQLPAHGTLSGEPPNLTYTPAQDYGGPDSLAFTVSDGTATSAAASVNITVTAYTLVGIQNVPPAPVARAKAGSSVPMKWQFRDGSIVVNSAAVQHTVELTGPIPGGTTRVYTNTDPGGSSFRYDALTNSWYFNLQTKDASGMPYRAGDYEVRITPTTAGFLPRPMFILRLTK